MHGFELQKFGIELLIYLQSDSCDVQAWIPNAIASRLILHRYPLDVVKTRVYVGHRSAKTPLTDADNYNLAQV